MTGQRQVGAFMDAKPSGADLTGKEFHFCLVDAAGTLQLCGDGGAATGVIEEGKTVGRSSTYATAGQLKVVCGVGGLDEGQQVASDANGQAVVAGAGDEILGVAMTPGAAGELACVNFNPKGLHV